MLFFTLVPMLFEIKNTWLILLSHVILHLFALLLYAVAKYHKQLLHSKFHVNYFQEINTPRFSDYPKVNFPILRQVRFSQITFIPNSIHFEPFNEITNLHFIDWI